MAAHVLEMMVDSGLGDGHSQMSLSWRKEPRTCGGHIGDTAPTSRGEQWNSPSLSQHRGHLDLDDIICGISSHLGKEPLLSIEFKIIKLSIPVGSFESISFL
jgi:hypothetical protein